MLQVLQGMLLAILLIASITLIFNKKEKKKIAREERHEGKNTEGDTE